MGEPPHRGEQYSIRFVCGQEPRSAKEGLCMMEDAQSAIDFGGQLGNVAFPGKIMADNETQKLE